MYRTSTKQTPPGMILKPRRLVPIQAGTHLRMIALVRPVLAEARLPVYLGSRAKTRETLQETCSYKLSQRSM